MKNFIEITVGKRKMLININHTILVQPNLPESSFDKVDDTCLIDVSNGNAGTIRKNSQETYDQIKELIELASK